MIKNTKGFNSHIVICGHSLCLDAIAAMLQNESNLLVTQLHERSGMVERVAALAPDVLIIESGMFDRSLLCTLSAGLMGVPIIEVHILHSVLTIHTIWETPVSGLEHLAQMLEYIVPLAKLPYTRDETQMLRVGL